MNRAQVQARLKQYRWDEFRDKRTGSFFKRLFRYWFGLFENPRFIALQNYIDDTLYDERARVNIAAKTLPQAELAFKSSNELLDAVLDEIKNEPSYSFYDGNADLSVFPSSHGTPNASTQLTLGDLHGNAMKLIYFLIREGVIENITPEDYQELLAIYKTDVSVLTGAQIDRFNEILEKFTKTSNGVGRVRLIGDVLADRGSFDPFTLRVLRQLKKLDVPVKINISNHDIEFLRSYTGLDMEVHIQPTGLGKNQSRSLDNLKLYLKRCDAAERTKRISELKESTTAYYSQLEALGYSLSQDGKSITLYTHAPVGLEVVESLAKALDLDFKDETPQALAQTIDAINYAIDNEYGSIQAFYKKVKEIVPGINIARLHSGVPIKKLYKEFLKKGQIAPGAQEKDVIKLLKLLAPMDLLVWNRKYKNLKRKAKNYSIYFVHGHDQSEKNPPANVYNLDSNWCKWVSQNCQNEKGEYIVHRTEANTGPCARNALLESLSASIGSPNGAEVNRHSPRPAPKSGLPVRSLGVVRQGITLPESQTQTFRNEDGRRFNPAVDGLSAGAGVHQKPGEDISGSSPSCGLGSDSNAT